LVEPVWLRINDLLHHGLADIFWELKKDSLLLFFELIDVHFLEEFDGLK